MQDILGTKMKALSTLAELCIRDALSVLLEKLGMADSLMQQMCVENVLHADLLVMLLPSPGWITGPCISATNFFLQPVERNYFSCQALSVKKEYLVRAVWVTRVKVSGFHLYHSPLFAKAWNVLGGAWKKGRAGSGGHTLHGEPHMASVYP